MGDHVDSNDNRYFTQTLMKAEIRHLGQALADIMESREYQKDLALARLARVRELEEEIKMFKAATFGNSEA